MKIRHKSLTLISPWLRKYPKAISLINCEGMALEAAAVGADAPHTLRDQTNTAGVRVSCTGIGMRRPPRLFPGPAGAGPLRSAMTGCDPGAYTQAVFGCGVKTF